MQASTLLKKRELKHSEELKCQGKSDKHLKRENHLEETVGINSITTLISEGCRMYLCACILRSVSTDAIKAIKVDRFGSRRCCFGVKISIGYQDIGKAA